MTTQPVGDSGGAADPWQQLFPATWSRASNGLKKIPLGEKASLSLGAQARYRMESKDNADFDDDQADKDTFHLLRMRVNALLTLGDPKDREHVKAYVEGQWAEAFMFDVDPDPSSVEDHFDFLEYWIEVPSLPTWWAGWPVGWRARIGRQKLAFADERLVGAFEWSNVARRFEGVRFMHRGAVDMDFWWARVVDVQDEKWNDWGQEDFFGFWFAGDYPGGGPVNRPLQWFVLVRSNGEGATPREGGGTGDDAVWTVGFRWEETFGDWEVVVQPVGQLGKYGGRPHRAWALHLLLARNFPDAPCRPRLAFEYNFASGDSDPNDNRHHTFDQLYPTNHLHYGYFDLVGYRNIHNVKLELSGRPCDRLKLLLAWHLFWLAEPEDALYNAGGRAMLRDSTGNGGRFAGSELDLLARWQVNQHASLLLGWSHFFPGGFVRHFADKGDGGDYFYVMWQMDL